MKVAFRTGNKIELRDTKLRPLRPDEIRIKVDACGICGTDLIPNPDEDNSKGVPFGHEMAGTVLEMGTSVTGLKKGQKIVVESSTPCGKCTNCRNARQELCTDIQSFFFLNNFGFAEETIVPAINAIPCDYLPLSRSPDNGWSRRIAPMPPA